MFRSRAPLDCIWRRDALPCDFQTHRSPGYGRIVKLKNSQALVLFSVIIT
jgi:hypothetical protein